MDVARAGTPGRERRNASIPRRFAPVPDARGRRSLWEAFEPADAKRIRARLETWQVEYAKGLEETGLVDFLRARPLVAVVGDALVVHGGPRGRAGILLSGFDFATYFKRTTRTSPALQR